MTRFGRIVAALASGLLLAASFPDVEVGPLAWIALVPLLLAVRGQSPRRAAAYGWLAGVAFFVPVLYWVAPTISNYTRLGTLAAAGLCLLMCAAAAYTFALFASGLEAFARAGASRLLVAPFLWVVVEWMRTFVIAGFPWASLGYSQYRALAVIQIADLGGVYAVSALVMAVNAGLVEAWCERSKRARVLAVTALLPIAAVAYGRSQLGAVERAEIIGSLPIAFVQANIPQAEKWDSDLQDAILTRYLELSSDAAAAGAKLIAWPEASVPFYLEHDARSVALGRFAAERRVHLLVGSPGLRQTDGGLQPLNQAWLVTPEPRLEGPYDKMQLVPFGEYVPLAGLFGSVQIVVEAVGEFGRGVEHVVFEGPPLEGTVGPPAEQRAVRFGTLICYEGIFPALTRGFVTRGADLLINISNDAWYGYTSAPWQHLSMVALRAVENRVPIVRSTNTGVSAFIEATGAIGATSPLFEPDIGVERVLLRRTDSFYRRFGDVFVTLSGAVVMLVALVSAFRRVDPRPGA